MTPMPPTKSEIAATVPSSKVNVSWVSMAAWRNDAMLRTLKSSALWRALSNASTRAWVASISVASFTLIVMLLR